MNKIIEKCPVCSNQDLFVEKIRCSKCGTGVEGEFLFQDALPDGLDKELFHFLKVFIFAEGSIKQTERLLNCSYPKVKNYLKKLKVALNLDVEEDEYSLSYEDVLLKVESGEMTVEEAMKFLK